MDENGRPVEELDNEAKAELAAIYKKGPGRFGGAKKEVREVGKNMLWTIEIGRWKNTNIKGQKYDVINFQDPFNNHIRTVLILTSLENSYSRDA